MSELISCIKDLVITVAALTGAVVAVLGLNTWKRQLQGHTEYELARRLLVSLFKYRDAIDQIRHPVMWAYEMPTPPEERAEKMSEQQISYYGTSKAYEARWSKEYEIRMAMYADLLEAEALWGDDLNDLLNSIHQLRHELYQNISNYLRVINPDESQATKDAYQEIRERERDIMYDSLGDEDDDFKREFKEDVKKIEEYLKPKLKY